ncbi:hypothetical protein MRS44_008577 [Fusarium solani]|uniref:uncharacterized protein n=1 Tax=Fusarium solani TaxID=169388 RepID=UPI0032C41A07|nr:hypothetical protein MRS44_008577 [Fusarium solani]
MLIRLDSLTEQARLLINSRLDDLDSSLHQQINKAIHSHPETAYEEFFAHDTITKYLQDLGFRVTKHAYGLKTSFEASLGSGGRQVVFCAEYDALPGIGHGCGHNLIATASVGAFLGAAHALATLKIPGRLRLLGTPAEENGCGKGKLIEAGAFDPPEDVAAAIMAHAVPASLIDSDTGVAGLRLISSHQFRVEFRGHAAHAGGEPWNGVNALDAAVAAYSNVSLLRQQIHPDERIHGVIEDGGTIPGVIPDYTRMHWNVRSPTMERGEKLLQRVKACLEAGAAATGFLQHMARLGQTVALNMAEPATASTDMGNVSYLVPSFHGAFTITSDPNVAIHSPKFAEAASTDEAHGTAIKTAKGMAMLAMRVLIEENVAAGARRDFETDK